MLIFKGRIHARKTAIKLHKEFVQIMAQKGQRCMAKSQKAT